MPNPTKATVKKAAAKRKPATRPEELITDPGVIEMVSESEDVEHDRIPIFTIDGVTHSIEDRPRANLAIKFMWRMKTVGEEQAGLELLPEVLGDELMMVLSEYKDLTTENMEQITEKVMSLVFGNGGVDSQGN